MNIVVFDTETTSLDKPFCYNIGYVIARDDTTILDRKEFVVEQIWHNLPLFNTAYYADKRQIYIDRMRARAIKMDKFGYICSEMRRDFAKHNVEIGFAYNSGFDDRVFTFNSDWYKCINPFETMPTIDIRGYVHQFLIDDKFKQFCEKNKYFTENGNYSTTAETLFRYISNNNGFNEEHTALADAEIETKILFECVARGAQIGIDYPVERSIERAVQKTLTVIDSEKNETVFPYTSMRINKDRTKITLKNV